MSWEAPVLGLMLGVGVLLGFQGFAAMTNRSLPDAARRKGMWRLNAGVTLAVVSMVANRPRGAASSRRTSPA